MLSLYSFSVGSILQIPSAGSGSPVHYFKRGVTGINGTPLFRGYDQEAVTPLTPSPSTQPPAYWQPREAFLLLNVTIKEEF